MDSHAVVRLRVRVAPGARRSAVVGRYGDGWKLRVSAQPERGHANDAVTRLIARSLDVSHLNITIVAGASSRDKVVEVTGVTRDEVERRLAAEVAAT